MNNNLHLLQYPKNKVSDWFYIKLTSFLKCSAHFSVLFYSTFVSCHSRKQYYWISSPRNIQKEHFQVKIGVLSHSPSAPLFLILHGNLHYQQPVFLKNIIPIPFLS